MTTWSKEKAWLIRDKYQGDPQVDLTNDLTRLKKGEPLAYVIGSIPFLNCQLDLRYHPLIPRPETEYWVKQFLQRLKQTDSAGRILDLGAGSGCIGIAVLKNAPASRVVLADIDPSLVKQIKINLTLNQLRTRRTRVLCSDLFSQVTGKFDFILVNPPYIPTRRKLDQTVVAWEPAQALWGGEQGLDVITKILAQARTFLKPHGEIWLEFDASQKTRLAKMISTGGQYTGEFHRDQFHRWRWVVLRVRS